MTDLEVVVLRDKLCELLQDVFALTLSHIVDVRNVDTESKDRLPSSYGIGANQLINGVSHV